MPLVIFQYSETSSSLIYWANQVYVELYYISNMTMYWFINDFKDEIFHESPVIFKVITWEG